MAFQQYDSRYDIPTIRVQWLIWHSNDTSTMVDMAFQRYECNGWYGIPTIRWLMWHSFTDANGWYGVPTIQWWTWLFIYRYKWLIWHSNDTAVDVTFQRYNGWYGIPTIEWLTWHSNDTMVGMAFQRYNGWCWAVPQLRRPVNRKTLHRSSDRSSLPTTVHDLDPAGQMCSWSVWSVWSNSCCRVGAV